MKSLRNQVKDYGQTWSSEAGRMIRKKKWERSGRARCARRHGQGSRS